MPPHSNLPASCQAGQGRASFSGPGERGACIKDFFDDGEESILLGFVRSTQGLRTRALAGEGGCTSTLAKMGQAESLPQREPTRNAWGIEYQPETLAYAERKAHGKAGLGAPKPLPRPVERPRGRMAGGPGGQSAVDLWVAAFSPPPVRPAPAAPPASPAPPAPKAAPQAAPALSSRKAKLSRVWEGIPLPHARPPLPSFRKGMRFSPRRGAAPAAALPSPSSSLTAASGESVRTLASLSSDSSGSIAREGAVDAAAALAPVDMAQAVDSADVAFVGSRAADVAEVALVSDTARAAGTATDDLLDSGRIPLEQASHRETQPPTPRRAPTQAELDAVVAATRWPHNVALAALEACGSVEEAILLIEELARKRGMSIGPSPPSAARSAERAREPAQQAESQPLTPVSQPDPQPVQPVPPYPTPYGCGAPTLPDAGGAGASLDFGATRATFEQAHDAESAPSNPMDGFFAQLHTLWVSATDAPREQPRAAPPSTPGGVSSLGGGAYMPGTGLAGPGGWGSASPGGSRKSVYQMGMYDRVTTNLHGTFDTVKGGDQIYRGIEA